jgi:hypothetical protein
MEAKESGRQEQNPFTRPFRLLMKAGDFIKK